MSLNKPRVYVYLALLMLFLLIVLYSFINIILSQKNQSLYTFSTENQRTIRGTILDRNDEILAIQEPSYNLSIWKPELRDEEESIELLALTLGHETDVLRKKIAPSRNYILLERSISNTSVKQIRSLQEAGALQGVHLEENLNRSYPFREYSGPFVGYVNVDNKGLDGVEYVFDDELAQGHSVRLTLDVRLQQLLQSYIQDRLSDRSTKREHPAF